MGFQIFTQSKVHPVLLDGGTVHLDTMRLPTATHSD